MLIIKGQWVVQTYCPLYPASGAGNAGGGLFFYFLFFVMTRNMYFKEVLASSSLMLSTMASCLFGFFSGTAFFKGSDIVGGQADGVQQGLVFLACKSLYPPAAKRWKRGLQTCRLGTR